MLVLMGQKPLLITVMILGVLSTTTRYTSDARGWSALMTITVSPHRQTEVDKVKVKVKITLLCLIHFYIYISLKYNKV